MKWTTWTEWTQWTVHSVHVVSLVSHCFFMKPHVLILGAGPAGLGAAYKLAQQGNFQVTVLEKNPSVGGNAGSFQLAGQYVDYGSHRLHPSCEPEVMADIRHLLGDDLLDRPRHGRIRLQKRWIHFPLKPFDLALRLPPRFALGVARDLAAKAVPERFAAERQLFLSPRSRPRPDYLPGVLFSLRAEDLGSGS